MQPVLQLMSTHKIIFIVSFFDEFWLAVAFAVEWLSSCGSHAAAPGTHVDAWVRIRWVCTCPTTDGEFSVYAI